MDGFLNSAHGTNLVYEETKIERKKIENSIYKTFSNDVSMLINGRLVVLIEHQSTLNENMPLRLLEYFVHLLYGIIPSRARYRKSLYKIPSPEFYVLYDGNEPAPLEQELKLSDAFMIPQDEPFCEARVKFINISKSGRNVGQKNSLPILTKCDSLKEYCEFMDLVFSNLGLAVTQEEKDTCYERSIHEAVRRGILSDYLKRKGSEVINMFFGEYSYEEDIATQREEAWEEGMSIGRETGSWQKAVEDATNLLKLDMLTSEQIAQVTGLNIDQVLELRDEL